MESQRRYCIVRNLDELPTIGPDSFTMGLTMVEEAQDVIDNDNYSDGEELIAYEVEFKPIAIFKVKKSVTLEDVK